MDEEGKDKDPGMLSTLTNLKNLGCLINYTTTELSQHLNVKEFLNRWRDISIMKFNVIISITTLFLLDIRPTQNYALQLLLSALVICVYSLSLAMQPKW